MIIIYKLPKKQQAKIKLIRLLRSYGAKPYRLSFCYIIERNQEIIEKLIQEFGGEIVAKIEKGNYIEISERR
ncbi:MAG: hypothetical protein QW156_04995 [Candidatus Aenigmatarchaeota archaeon]